MVAKFSACCLRASSTTSPAPGAIHWSARCRWCDPWCRGCADQRHDVGAGVRDGAEQLPAAPGRLGVADAHLQVPFALVAAPDECRIQAEGDRGRCGRIHGVRLDRGGSAQSLAELERMTTQGPWFFPAAT